MHQNSLDMVNDHDLIINLLAKCHRQMFAHLHEAATCSHGVGDRPIKAFCKSFQLLFYTAICCVITYPCSTVFRPIKVPA